MTARTFTVTAPHMRGDDVRDFQRRLNGQFDQWEWDHKIPVDGDYGVGTRSAAATVLYGLGMRRSLMADGVTPEVRRKIRDRDRTPGEQARWVARLPWRRAQRQRYAVHVASPLHTILADSWGWHPGVHDGIDLICPPESPLYAVTDATVVRADAGGWWGKAPSGDVSKGDGIIILRCTATVGPFRPGLNLCYGHAEHAAVRAGDTVKAGQVIGRAGLAVAWHTHFMVNGNMDTRGVGDRDPRPYLDWARKNTRR